MPKVPKVVHVKSAYKYNPKAKVKKGGEYWWWATTVKGKFIKRFFKKKPKRSQLTNSEFWRTVFQVREMVEESNPVTGEEFNELRTSAMDRLEEFNEVMLQKRDSLPDGFRRGKSGELFTERMEAISSVLADMPDKLDEGFVTPTEIEVSMRAMKSALEGVTCE